MRMSTLTRYFVKEAVSKYVNHFVYVNKSSMGTEKYRKTTFEWESPKGKKFNPSGIRNRNYHDEEKSKFGKQKFTSTNTNQSLTTQMNRVKSIEAYLKLYNEHKQFFSLRLIAFGSRLLCILIQRERNNLFEASKEKQKNRLSETTKKNLKEYLNEVFQLYPKLKMEEAQKQQLKNFLFVTKKVFYQFEQILDLKQDSQNFDQQFSRKAARFRDQLLSIFSQPEFKMNDYEINLVVEIFYNLIKFSPEKELSSIYHSILERKQQIADNINPQLLFSTTNFFLTIKMIEQNENKVERNTQRSTKDQNNDESNELRSVEAQIKMLTPIMQLREQCYRLFFNKWLYYYEDMKELIKLNDVKGVWYLIWTSDSGIKLLLENKNGPRTIDIVSLILSHHKSSIEQISQHQWRVFSNIAALLIFLDKRHPSNERILQLKESFVKIIKNTQIIEKGRMKLKMKTLVQKLHNQRLINSVEQTDGLAFINQI